jgi:hypothetical protein
MFIHNLIISSRFWKTGIEKMHFWDPKGLLEFLYKCKNKNSAWITRQSKTAALSVENAALQQKKKVIGLYF